MDSERLSYAPDSLVEEVHHYDEAAGVQHFETIQDVEPIIEANKQLQNLPTSLDRWGDGKRVASIPLVVYEDLRKRGIIGDQKKLRAWLNDQDNRHFRTFPGRV